MSHKESQVSDVFCDLAISKDNLCDNCENCSNCILHFLDCFWFFVRIYEVKHDSCITF